MRSFEQVSPSQINDFRTCQRLWWWQKIFGLSKPQKDSAALGEEVHHLLEAYLEEGTIPDAKTEAGKIATPGLVHLPRPKADTVYVELDMTTFWTHPEHPIRMTLADIPVSGRIDLLDLVDLPEVTDHKTTAHMKYAKTADELRTDTQMVIYGLFALLFARAKGRQAAAVRAGHVVYATRGPAQAKATRVELTEAHIREQWKVLSGVVETMKTTAAIRAPHLVTPTLSACSAYGGCFFRSKCKILGTFGGTFDVFGDGTVGSFASLNDDFDLFAADEPRDKETEMTTTPNALMAKLEAAKAAREAAKGNGAGQPVNGAPAPAVQPSTPSQPTAAQQAALAAQQAAQQAAATAKKAAENAAAVALQAQLAADQAAAAATGAVGVVPADAPTPDDPELVDLQSTLAENKSGDDVSDGKPTRRPAKFKEKLGAIGWDEATIMRMSPAAMRAILEAEPQIKPGGTAHIDDEGNLVGGPNPAPAPAQAQQQAPAQAQAQAQQPAQGPGPGEDPAFALPVQKKDKWVPPAGWTPPAVSSAPRVTRAPGQTGLWLYIDCFPEKGFHAVNHATLEDMIQPILKHVAKELDLPHFSLAEFGNGPKTVGAVIAMNVERILDMYPTIVIGKSSISTAAIEMLAPHAVVIVRSR